MAGSLCCPFFLKIDINMIAKRVTELIPAKIILELTLTYAEVARTNLNSLDGVEFKKVRVFVATV